MRNFLDRKELFDIKKCIMPLVFDFMIFRISFSDHTFLGHFRGSYMQGFTFRDCKSGDLTYMDLLPEATHEHMGSLQNMGYISNN